MNLRLITLAMAALVVFMLIGSIALILAASGRPASTIDSFDDCVNAGYPVQESFPARCTTDDGETFTATESTF